MPFSACVGTNEKEILSIDWAITGSLPSGAPDNFELGVAGALAGVHNNVLIVGGGANFPDSMPWLGGQKKYHDKIILFRRDQHSLDLVSAGDMTLPNPVAYGASCSTSNGVLYAGGENGKELLKKVFLVSWREERGEIETRRLPDLPIAVANASIAVDESDIYVAGGETGEDVSRKFFRLQLDDPNFFWTALPDLPQPVSHAVMIVQSAGERRYIYVIGGRRKTADGLTYFYRSTYRFDAKTNQWEEAAPLPYALSAGTGVAAGNHKIILFGGDKGETFRRTEELVIAIAREKDETKKRELLRRKAEVQSSHPGFSNEVLLYDASRDSWKSAGFIPFPVPVTTTAVSVNECEVLIVSGEIRAGVRTPAILRGQFVYTRDEPR